MNDTPFASKSAQTHLFLQNSIREVPYSASAGYFHTFSNNFHWGFRDILCLEEWICLLSLNSIREHGEASKALKKLRRERIYPVSHKINWWRFRDWITESPFPVSAEHSIRRHQKLSQISVGSGYILVSTKWAAIFLELQIPALPRRASSAIKFHWWGIGSRRKVW